MLSIGSSSYINIVVQLHTRLAGQKITHRYFIEKNYANPEGFSEEEARGINSSSLVSCCKRAIQNYPAENYALILWGYGNGPPKSTFCCNQAHEKGISYQELNYALKEICNNYLKGERVALVGFDAGHTAMLELANTIKDYAEIMIGSQKSTLGSGWNYKDILFPFLQKTVSNFDFAKIITKTYHKNYSKLSEPYTLSGIDLTMVDQLTDSINIIARELINTLQSNQSKLMRIIITKNRNNYSKSSKYIDLFSFFSGLAADIKERKLDEENISAKDLVRKLEQACQIIKKVVTANACNTNIKVTNGISIYFPTRTMHTAYTQDQFGTPPKWTAFLECFLLHENENQLSLQ